MLSAAAVLAASLVAAAPSLSEEAPRRVGFAVEAGIPEGVGASVVVRPWWPVRLQFGPATNGAAMGARAGVVLSPLRTFARPTLTAHAGRFNDGDLRGLLGLGGDLPGPAATLASKVSYDFASAHLGLELGRPERFSFFARLGVTRVRARLPALLAAAREAWGDASLSTRTPLLHLTGPSAQVGFVVLMP